MGVKGWPSSIVRTGAPQTACATVCSTNVRETLEGRYRRAPLHGRRRAYAGLASCWGAFTRQESIDSKGRVGMLLAHTYKRAKASPLLLLITPPLIGCASSGNWVVETVLRIETPRFFPIIWKPSTAPTGSMMIDRSDSNACCVPRLDSVYRQPRPSIKLTGSPADAVPPDLMSQARFLRRRATAATDAAAGRNRIARIENLLALLDDAAPRRLAPPPGPRCCAPGRPGPG